MIKEQDGGKRILNEQQGGKDESVVFGVFFGKKGRVMVSYTMTLMLYHYCFTLTGSSFDASAISTYIYIYS